MSKSRVFLLIGAATLLAAIAAIRIGGFLGSARAPALPAGPAVSTADSELEAAAETRRLAMQDAFADLEKDRLLLNSQLGSLNASLWGIRVPAARAQSIQADMMRAKDLITDPPLLGAFEDVAAIQRERERVAAALARLQALETELRSGPSG